MANIMHHLSLSESDRLMLVHDIRPVHDVGHLVWAGGRAPPPRDGRAHGPPSPLGGRGGGRLARPQAIRRERDCIDAAGLRGDRKSANARERREGNLPTATTVSTPTTTAHVAEGMQKIPVRI